MALVPLFLVSAYSRSRGGALAALVVFLVASLSDLLDGYLARRSSIVTRTGEFLDPLADKLLVGAALVALVATRGFPLWAASVIAAREVTIQLLRTRIVKTGGTLPASRFAKVKTLLQICMVSWWLLPWDEISVVHGAWVGATLVATVLSGAEYFARRPRREVGVER